MARNLKIGELSIPEPAEIGLSRKALGKVVDHPLFGKHGMSADRSLEYKFNEVLLADTGVWKYWLNTQLKFNLQKGEPLFRSASLIVLRSALAFDSEKKHILRAEWERREDAVSRPLQHAQPHWHVYNAELERTAADQAIERFHFAMATGWHLGQEDSHYREPSPENVAAWIQHCTRYTHAQLMAITRKD
jgi:hypothetical protein